MTFPVIVFPAIDPVVVEIGPFAIRWYALAYVAGLIIGWRYMIRLARAPGAALTVRQVDDLLVWITFGVVLGGRLGFVLFYNPAYYAANPLDVLKVWQGGMSFHGGLLGVVAALALFARRRAVPLLATADAIARVAPIGLFFGRIANFINGELFGRTTDVPWGVVFPGGGPEPRHPSQLYEAALEGIVLFVLVWLAARFVAPGHRPGLLTGTFCAGYAIARMVVELFREPDQQIGFLAGGTTMGQALSLPLLLFGLYLVARAWRRSPA